MGKQIPRAEAKAGDLIFWAKGGDCANSVSHVGIFMRDGWMVNAARKGTPVREQSIWTSSDGTSICPKAVRFVTPCLLYSSVVVLIADLLFFRFW